MCKLFSAGYSSEVLGPNVKQLVGGVVLETQQETLDEAAVLKEQESKTEDVLNSLPDLSFMLVRT